MIVCLTVSASASDSHPWQSPGNRVKAGYNVWSSNAPRRTRVTAQLQGVALRHHISCVFIDIELLLHISQKCVLMSTPLRRSVAANRARFNLAFAQLIDSKRFTFAVAVC